MSERISEVDAAGLDALLREAHAPVVVDFYSTECPPCEALAPKYEALGELYGEDLRFVKVFRQGNRELAERLAVRSSPTVLFFRDGQEVGQRLTGGIKRSELARELDALVPAPRVEQLHAQARPVETRCDVLILGAGPAGITAGIYAAQARLRTIMVDLGLGGGNLSITHQVSNFPGFPQPQPGVLLAHHLLEHAKTAGVEPRYAAELTASNLAEKCGRAVISDIVSDQDVPAHLQADPELWSGCVSGAMREDLLLRAFEEAGFYGISIVAREARPWRTVEGIEFRSVTLEAFKGKEGACVDQQQAVIYRGPFREVHDDDGHRLIRGQRVAVCAKTFEIYSKACSGTGCC